LAPNIFKTTDFSQHHIISKKDKFAPEDFFSAQGLTNKLCILLLVAKFTNKVKFIFLQLA